MAEYDVAIVGGGIVGATLALLLAEQAGLPAERMVLIEPAPAAAPRPGAPIGLRVSAIAPGSRARFVRLGVWQRLDAARICRYERMRVWHESVPPDSPDVLVFDAAEAGEPDLGCIAENAALQAALLAACAERGIRMLPAALQSLHVAAGAATLTLDGAVLRAELVVGADGANSTARQLLEMPATQQDYRQRAIVAMVRTARAHRHTAWQRFLATGPLALLPLPGDAVSIVWSAAEPRAAELLAMAPPEFNAALTAASAGVLGELALAGERAAFPLRRLAVGQYVRPRVALVGDAAHVIHPLAGQGVNQGLEDAAALTAHLAARPARESPGALAALLRYQRERRAGNALVAGVVDGLDRLFTRPPGPVSRMARAGMAVVARSLPARRLLVRQAAAGRSSPRR
ncbi:MAG TPA: FAD-dependent monooxygenase [Steroidobacteraceae bacterium]|nr:FAD-dependent monooxygenase [Steroidobacteraceae bacterium]